MPATCAIAVRFLRLCAVVVSITLVGCMQTSSQRTGSSGSAADSFDDEDESRETVLIEPKEGVETAYDVRPAHIDTALIRAQDYDVTGAIVEVLVKGTFPDGCSELNELDQSPSRNGQDVTLTMRRPTEAICTQVVRPYRFFFTLDRRFTPGEYTLSINGRALGFSVRGV